MTPTALFMQGARRSIPVILTAGPFGALFGALAVEQSLTISEAVAMSLFLFAGASQLVGIELFGQFVPGWIIVLSIFAVNFRHILYSASVGKHFAQWGGFRQYLSFFFLIDPSYAESERRLEQGHGLQFWWFMGLSIPTYIAWSLLTFLGAVFGNFMQNSHQWGIDFILPIYFMGLVLGFRKRSFWLPVVATSATASILASQTIGSPWHVSVGAIAGVLFAALFAPTARDGAKPDQSDADASAKEGKS